MFNKTNVMNLYLDDVLCYIMHYGDALTPSQTTNFGLFQTERVCR